MNSIISNKKIITAALGLVLTGFTSPSQVWADPADQKSTDSAPFRFQSTANILAKDQGTPEKMPDELPSDLYPASEGVYSGQEPAHTNRATDSATHEGEATNPAPGRPALQGILLILAWKVLIQTMTHRNPLPIFQTPPLLSPIHRDTMTPNITRI